MATGGKVIFLAVLVLAVTHDDVTGQGANSTASTLLPMSRLYNDFIAPYNNAIRPVTSPANVTKLFMRFHFLQLFDVDEATNTIKINVWIEFWWQDEIRYWNPDDYEGIEFLEVEKNLVWKPRMVSVNSYDQRRVFESSDNPVMVYHHGTNYWLPSDILTFSCALDLSQFPFDHQECQLKMHTTDMAREVELFDHGLLRDDLRKLPNNEWDVYAVNTDHVTVIPDTSIVNRDVHLVVIRFFLRRKAGFFLVNTILPVNVLTLMSLVVFFIPDDSGEKISYSVTILLSTGIYLSSVSSHVPGASENLPIVMIYLFSLYIFCVLALITSLATTHWRRKCVTDGRTLDVVARSTDDVSRKATSDWPPSEKSRTGLSDKQEIPLTAQDNGGGMFHRRKVCAYDDVGDKGGGGTRLVHLDQQRAQGVGWFGKMKMRCGLDLVIVTLFMALWCLVTITFLYKMTEI